MALGEYLFPRLYRIKAALLEFFQVHTIRIMSILLVCCASIDSVLYMRLIKQMYHHAFLLSQFIYPLSFSVVTFIISLLYYRQRIFYLPEPSAAAEDKDESKVERFSLRQHWKTVLMFALSDTFSGTLSVLPVLYLPTIILLIIGQTTLPLNMFLSIVILKVQFERVHYYATILVILGVITASYSVGGGSSAALDGQLTIIWILVLLIIKMIDSYVSIFRERRLKDLQLKSWHTMVWVSIIQLPMSLLFLFIVFMPFPKPFQQLQVAEFAAYMRNAFACLSSNALERIPSISEEVYQKTNAGCQSYNNMALFFFFLFFNIIYNISSLTLIRLRSSNFAISTATVKIGLTAFLLSQPAIAGGAYQVISFMNVIGFLVIVVSLSVYNTAPIPEYKGTASTRINSHGEEEHLQNPVQLAAGSGTIVLESDEEVSMH